MRTPVTGYKLDEALKGQPLSQLPKRLIIGKWLTMLIELFSSIFWSYQKVESRALNTSSTFLTAETKSGLDEDKEFIIVVCKLKLNAKRID
jgi:hypothetical protein